MTKTVKSAQACLHTLLPLVLVSLIGCDKLQEVIGGSQSSPETAASDTPAADAPKPAESSPPAPTPAPTPEPTPTPAPSEFDTLLVRVSGLPAPRSASEPSVDEVNKTAWSHYKAKRYADAAQQFARVAARDGQWKHAHNLACASAKLGKLDDTRVALAESFARGGDAAKASANKDADLVDARAQAWFDALSTSPPAPNPSPEPSEPSEDDEDTISRDAWPPSCPPDLRSTDEHWCWRDVIATFTFSEVVFDRPITLDLAVPTRPTKRPWAPVKGKISMAEVREQLGIQSTTETYETRDAPEVMFGEELNPLEENGVDTKPFFWWPEPNTPILVLLQRQKLGKMRFVGVILARQTAEGWRAVNLEVVTAKQDTAGSNLDIESTIGFRSDGLELFTLSQQGLQFDDESAPSERWLCRIRWEQGKLARACVDRWSVFDPG